MQEGGTVVGLGHISNLQYLQSLLGSEKKETTDSDSVDPLIVPCDVVNLRMTLE